MGTLTIKIPPTLQAKLDALVARRKRTKSALVREAIEWLVSEEPISGASAHDMLKDLQAQAQGRGIKDLSTNRKHLHGFGE